MYPSKKIVFIASAIFVLVAVGVVFFSEPFSTRAAHFVWGRYHSGALALALDRRDAPLALQIGNDAFGIGAYNPPLAEKAFRKAVSIDPGIFWGHYQLARVLFVEANLKDAEIEINKELRYHPSNLRALYVRGLVYAYEKNLPAATLDFEHFTEWAPTEWAGYNDLAWVLAQESHYIEAKAALERGFKNAIGAASNPWLWNNLGVQELNLRDYKNAIASFEKAKTLATSLSAHAWKSAYPGNNPSGSAEEIKAFQDAIETNLARARAGLF